MELRGAEAIVRINGDVKKERIRKGYRIREIDEFLRSERTRNEAKIISDARKAGVPTPIIYDISDFEIRMEKIDGVNLREGVDEKLCEKIGELVGKLHSHGIIHGDLTTSNMILSGKRIYLIDFGLAFYSTELESRGVDVHVFFQALKSTYDDPSKLIDAFKRGYRRTFQNADEVLKRVEEIERRGRYLK